MAGGKFDSQRIIFGLYFFIFTSLGQDDLSPDNSIGIYYCMAFVLNRFCTMVVCVFLAVILQEPQQTDLNVVFNRMFSAVAKTEELKFNLKFIQIDRNHLDESLASCERNLKFI